MSNTDSDQITAPAEVADDPAASLDGGVPVTLFPIRIETRFSSDRTELAIRVFPEQIHVDDHAPDLTGGEISLGRSYWAARWVPDDPDSTSRAWLDLTGQVDPPRARWIVQVLTPTNLDQIGAPGVEPRFPTVTAREAQMSAPPVARLLPARWVALGYRGDDEVFRVWSQDVDRDLVVGIGPTFGDPDDDNAPEPESLAELLGDDDLRWLIDFGAATSAGMAITVADDDLISGTLAEGVDQLVVLGVDETLDPTESSTAVATQLDRLSVTEGLSLLGLGIATNNTDTERSGPGTSPRLDPAAYDPAIPLTDPEAGLGLARALGAPGTDSLLGAARTRGLDDSVTASLVAGIWPGTIRFLAGLLTGWDDVSILDPTRDHAMRYLRPGGPHPTIRIGDQPYGVLPVLSAATTTGDDLTAQLSRVLDGIRRRHWTTVDADPVPHLVGSDDPEADLVNLLRRTPSSVTFRYRPVAPAIRSIITDPDHPATDSYLFVDPYEPFDIEQQPGIEPVLLTLVDSKPAPLPPVSFDPLSEEEPLGDGTYLTEIADLVSIGGIGAVVALLLLPTPERRTVLDILLRVGAAWVALGDGKFADPDGNPTIEDSLVYASHLRRLAQVPTAELHRRAMGVLDTVTHRLDAWITSVATAQLDTIRETEPGCHIGGFGYVENLRPSDRPASDGYIHAPSVTHASTAAILRSGHLARSGDGDQALALDLSSERVERGLELIRGVGDGQPVGALLGYRFERGLRDRDIALARYILPFRQSSPLLMVPDLPFGGQPLETVAARNVVDGLVLVKKWRKEGDGLLDEVGVDPADRSAVNAVLARIDDTLDAVSDLLVAESVHQVVAGNTERAAAALDAIDRQESIPDPQFIRTPRTGVGYDFRVAVLAGPVVPAPGWEGIDDPRRAAEPRLDRWIGTVLGSPDRFVLSADAVDSAGATVETVTATLAELGLSAVSSVVAAGNAGQGGSELEARLALHLGTLVTAPDVARLVLLSDPPPGSGAGALGLGDLLDLASGVLDLVGAGRPIDNRDLALDRDDEVTAGFDVGELQARADALVGSLATATGVLAGLSEGVNDVGELVAALLAAADAGVVVAVRGGPDPVRALVAAEEALAVVTGLEERFDRAAATEDEVVGHDLARIRSVLGEAFPVAPAFGADAAALAASSISGTLLGGDSLAPATWLGAHARVRAPVARLVEVMEASETLGGAAGLDQITVGQLPHRPGTDDRWIGLGYGPDREPAAGVMSLVAHLAPGTDWAQPLAGLVIDQWSDTVPETTETTGLALHIDTPGARAPQSILLAVPADRTAPSWSTDALAATVREAMDLARLRALDLDDLDYPRAVLPATWLFAGPGLLDVHLPDLIAQVSGPSDDPEETP